MKEVSQIISKQHNVHNRINQSYMRSRSSSSGWQGKTTNRTGEVTIVKELTSQSHANMLIQCHQQVYPRQSDRMETWFHCCAYHRRMKRLVQKQVLLIQAWKHEIRNESNLGLGWGSWRCAWGSCLQAVHKRDQLLLRQRRRVPAGASPFLSPLAPPGMGWSATAATVRENLQSATLIFPLLSVPPVRSLRLVEVATSSWFSFVGSYRYCTLGPNDLLSPYQIWSWFSLSSAHRMWLVWVVLPDSTPTFISHFSIVTHQFHGRILWNETESLRV
jgi:hypothetical protein